MSFINPIWLWGLLALLIPLIIHLWSRQKTRILPFGSLRFLQESSSSQSRSIQLTDVGLLLLRMLLFILLVFFIAQLALNKEVQNEKWLVLGENIEIPNSFKDSEYEIHAIEELKNNSTYINQWYFLQELSQNHPEIDSLIWIDEFANSDFWGAIPPLSFGFQLLNKSNSGSAQTANLALQDSVFYAVSGLSKEHAVVFHKVMKSNELYVQSKVVFEETDEELADIMISNELKDDFPLQFVLEQSGKKHWKAVENWPNKTIYVSEKYLNDKRLQDELLLLMSEQIAQYTIPQWRYNDWQQATQIKRSELDKALITNIVRVNNIVLFWFIVVLFLIERIWDYQKRNG